MRGRGVWIFALLGVALLFVVGSAEGAPGALDPSFGTGGIVTTAIGGVDDEAHAIALQPDGKIIAGGFSQSPLSFALVRYNPDGSLDTSFGSGGKVTTAISGVVYALALQPDGKIVAAGESYNGSTNYVFTLTRYNPDGSLDTTFGSGGIVRTPIFSLSSAFAYGVAVQPDGKIIAAGMAYDAVKEQFALTRYNPDGSLDTSFGNGGIVTTAFGTSSAGAYGLALQPDGKIVVAGYDSIDNFHTQVALARYNPDGSLDAGFGNGGTVTTAISGSDDEAYALTLQPDGKIVAAGESYDGTRYDFALLRYNPDGSLDTSFGNGGKVTTAVGALDPGDHAYAVTVEPDGRIVAAGDACATRCYEFALARYNPDGSLDTIFGSAGTLATQIGAGDNGRAISLQSDGKVVVAGAALVNSHDEFTLARYLGSTLTTVKAGPGSGTISSNPAGINCGSACTAPFAAVPVTLTATPAPGSVFVGWSGANCSGTSTCVVQLSNDESVTATFSLAPETLTVTKAGKGSGEVSSVLVAGISCGSICSHDYVHGTTVILLASPTSNSTFDGWSGACSGTGACDLAMDEAHTTTATFALACIVPKLTGKPLRGADRKIKQAHCRAGTVRHRYSKVKKGFVMSQKPHAGRHLIGGSRVSLVISRGRRP